MKVLILKLNDNKVDRQGHILRTSADVQFLPQVPIYQDFDKSKIMGMAKLERNGDNFYADIPDDIDKMFTPAIGAVILKSHVETNVVIDAFKIDQLAMTNSNCDDEIKSIQEQLKG